MLDPEIEAELERIRQADPEKKLHAEAIVEFARNPNTALHSRFVWNDEEAAHQQRLATALGIIRVSVHVMDRGDGSREPMRAYVSLGLGRRRKGNSDRGFLRTRDVLARPRQRLRLVDVLLKRIMGMLDSYRLPELDGLVDYITELRIELGFEDDGLPPQEPPEESTKKKRPKGGRPTANP